jgi:hypothetical protein
VLFYPLDPGSGFGMNFFRIPDPTSFLMKFSDIGRILVMLYFLNWATGTHKAYSINRKQQKNLCLLLLPPFDLGCRIQDEKFSDLGSGIKHPGSAPLDKGYLLRVRWLATFYRRVERDGYDERGGGMEDFVG